MNTGQEIKLLQKGQTPSLLNTKKGNELIEAVNALQKIEVQRKGDKDFISYSSNNVLLNLQQMPEAGGNLEGYEEFTTFFCVNGEGVAKTILVKSESS
jgi:hypothetical protein